MPDRPCLMPSACGATRSRHPHAASVPFVMPLGGIGVLFRQSGPALSTGPVTAVEVAAGPRRMEGVWGNAPGPTPGRSLQRISISQAVTKQACGSVVGRLLDTFDKGSSSVSALQHWPVATFARAAFQPILCRHADAGFTPSPPVPGRAGLLVGDLLGECLSLRRSQPRQPARIGSGRFFSLLAGARIYSQ